MKIFTRILLTLVLCLALCFSCASAEKAAPEPKELILTYGDVDMGEQAYPYVNVSPQNAVGKITYKSSDRKIATVDQDGIVTGLRAGTAVITGSFSNGVSAKYKITVNEREDPLKYKLLKDKSGYRITGCMNDRSFVLIPATYKGLPVKSIADRAFTDCDRIQGFYTDPDQATFYAAEGVLFTDDPVKTLVRFPNNYGMTHVSYRTPKGTAAVAPWAFSGLVWINNIHFRKGLESIGHHAFAEIKTAPGIYVPDTLREIGDSLFQNANGSAAFYGPEGSAAQEFASRNDIPFGSIYEVPVPENAAEPYVPETKNAKGVQKVDRAGIVEVNCPETVIYDRGDIACSFNLSSHQKEGVSEVRLVLRDAWTSITPDAEGKTRIGWSARTGLYGMGYTRDEAVIRGYDRDGKVTGVRKVSGNFVFSLPGASDLGVAGGSGTRLCVLPYEPVFISGPGAYRVNPDKLISDGKGRAYEYVIVMFPDFSHSTSSPYYLNIEGVNDTVHKSRPKGKCYTLQTVSFFDPYLIPEAGRIWNCYDGLNLLYEDKNLTVSANSGYGLTESYGRRIKDILTGMKKLMKNVLPEGYKVQKIDVAVNGKYPLASGGHIDLDQYVAVDDDSIGYTISHELVHTILVNSLGYEQLAPSAWKEGTAEYFSHRYCREKGYPYSEYPEKYDWSFLTEEDKADMGRYFCESTNRNTEYTLGYYFVDYVVRTYGEEAVRNIETELHRMAEKGVAEEKKTQTFVKIVRNATDKKVFEKFVKKVLN